MQKLETQDHQHVPVLDGIRGCAILLVMSYHFSIPFQHSTHLNIIDSWVATVLQMGWVGVDLFFALSGYLITNILYLSSDRPNYLKNFYVRRFLRIFPLYYAVLFLLIVLLPLLFPPLAHYTAQMQENQVWFWSYLVNWRIAWLGGFSNIQGGYMWSLAVEEQFYLVWPLVVLHLKSKLIPLCITLVVLMSIVRVIFLVNGMQPTAIYTMTLTHLDALLIGSAIAVGMKENRLRTKHIGIFLWLFSAAIAVVASILFVNGNFIFYTAEVAYIGLLAVAIISGYILLKAVTASEHSLLIRFFSMPLLSRFGKLCYGLYLLHHPTGVLMTEKILPQDSFIVFNSYLPCVILNIAITTALCYFIALLSFKLFETPFLNLKKHFI